MPLFLIYLFFRFIVQYKDMSRVLHCFACWRGLDASWSRIEDGLLVVCWDLLWRCFWLNKSQHTSTLIEIFCRLPSSLYPGGSQHFFLLWPRATPGRWHFPRGEGWGGLNFACIGSRVWSNTSLIPPVPQWVPPARHLLLRCGDYTWRCDTTTPPLPPFSNPASSLRRSREWAAALRYEQCLMNAPSFCVFPPRGEQRRLTHSEDHPARRLYVRREVSIQKL